jgi:hypothetical protein
MVRIRTRIISSISTTTRTTTSFPWYPLIRVQLSSQSSWCKEEKSNHNICISRDRLLDKIKLSDHLEKDHFMSTCLYPSFFMSTSEHKNTEQTHSAHHHVVNKYVKKNSSIEQIFGLRIEKMSFASYTTHYHPAEHSRRCTKQLRA